MNDSPHANAPPEPTLVRPTSRGFRWLIGVLLVVGAISRAAPLLNQDGRLLKQFPTEDGYLMLQIARNIALGHGMSTAEGTIATNGTQPLTTFLWAGCFRLAGGDKSSGVAYVHVLQMIIGAAAAFALYRMGRFLLKSHAEGARVAALAAAVWYAGPLTAKQTQNCLETGVYALVVVLVVWTLVAAWRDGKQPWSWWRCISLGLILGVAFWTRNDAAFLILAACLVRVGAGFGGGFALRGIAETFVVGITSVVVASPWLVYNVTQFGHLMPISGVSESMHAGFADNLHLIPVALAEYILAVLPIPNRMEELPAVIAASTVCVAAMVGLLLVVARRGDIRLRTFLLIVSIYGLGLCLFYGLFFGVGHFVNRYMFPLSPFLALLWAVVALWIWRRMRRPAGSVLTVLLVLLVIGLNARVYVRGRDHLHFPVIEWVAANVPDDVWVGAIQTGTLGFFHDRTINLDGKVNPEALEARKHDAIPQYVVDSDITYLADWAPTISTLHEERPLLRKHFDLIENDRQRNVGVLQRNALPST
jgi:hypothetical protein